MAAFRTLSDANVAGKRALVRVDFNVPMEGDRVTDDTRLRAALPTIADLRARGAKVILAAHFGRPKGQRNEAMSLRPVVEPLAALIGAPVAFAEDCVGPAAEAAASGLADGGVLLVENTRFHAGEEKNDPDFAKGLAALADLYVNDAFSAAHRAHASTEGVARLLPAYAGASMARELDYLEQALGGEPNRPVIAVVGGAKVSSKIDVLQNLVKKADMLAVGGGMANTFLAARGHEVGASLQERDLHDTARAIEAAAEEAGCRLILPIDAVVAEKFEAHAPHRVRPVDDVRAGEMILDLGPATVDALADAFDQARTLVWNGPLGAFELAPFDTATVEAAKYAAKRTREAGLVSVAGGGDTVAALNHACVGGDFTFVSTAGGAFLEWMEGRALPGVEALRA
ncbi:MAG: phosphoglycerate kinase [Caulobacterales bacterium]|nr:phosphoglycerate kinase [Caulobacterales bacterium]